MVSSAAVLSLSRGGVVAVRRLRRVDVPRIRAVAFVDDALHLLERGGHHRAAGLRRVEECILVHFLRLMRVADEHHVHVLVAALQEDIEQHVEPLGEVLHVLGHRAGHVHQAEHHRLRHRLRLRLELAVAHIERVDVRDQAGAAQLALELLLQFGAPRHGRRHPG